MDVTSEQERTPRLARRAEGRLLAGVCSGLADHLGLDPLHVRIAFALMAALSGFGVALYAAYWIALPVARDDPDAPPGLAAASRRGLRPRRFARAGDAGQLVALAVLGLGAVLLLQQTSLGVSDRFLWPALVVAAGLGLLWWQADQVARDAVEAAPSAPRGTPAGPRAARLVWLRMAVRVAGGALVVAAGLATFLAGSGGFEAVGQGLLAAAVVLLGVVLIVGPWLLRAWRSYTDERRERIRSQTRADFAAHLHDSVLQTLALIQQQAADPREVVHLARRQERDLRRFLYGEADAADQTLAAALRRVATEAEAAHRVPVDAVTVGDLPMDARAVSLLAAAREAVVNAARHSGAPAVDVFAEVTPESVSVFVRDRGSGFDIAAVPADRLGVKESVIGRMERAGGTATVRSAPGEGTEVRLEMRRRP